MSNDINLGILILNRLASPEIIRTVIDKIIKAFEDTIQTELIKVRLEEINRFSVVTTC